MRTGRSRHTPAIEVRSSARRAIWRTRRAVSGGSLRRRPPTAPRICRSSAPLRGGQVGLPRVPEEIRATVLCHAVLVWRGGGAAGWGGFGNGRPPVPLVTAADASLASFQRLEHEYALKAELDGAWAARPIELTGHNDRMTLVLEDPGGEPLDRLLGRPLAPSEFLRIAIGFANALCRM